MKTIKSKVKITIFIITVIVILIGVPVGKTMIRNYRITNELTTIAESRGLKDVKIHVVGKIPPENLLYEVTVDSSNLEDLTFSQMYSLADSMCVGQAFISIFTSNGNFYKIFPYTKSIYKNGDLIHDDYYNSRSYADATKNDKKESTTSTSVKSADSYSYTPRKSYSDDDDPYDAKDYAHPDDFYYDHYDDFYDYEDAEDYWNDNS